MQIKTLLARVLKDDRGATAVEYGMLVGLLFLGVIVGMDGFATQVEGLWHRIETGLR